MVPDTSRWRSDAAYDYFEQLPAAGLAWECLRRNEAYQKDFAANLKPASGDDRASDLLQRRWGLRFPCPSQHHLAGPVCRVDPEKP